MKTEEIAAASLEQEKVNVAIISSMNEALQTGNDMVLAVREVSDAIAGFYRELERLREEMKLFRTEKNANVA
jgi:methyl-accepting chemotaxis protein